MSESEHIKKLREACLKRGAHGIKGMGRQFRIMDDDSNKQLNMEEFLEGCNDFGIGLSPEDAASAFKAIDVDGSGQISFDEFLNKLRGPMSSSRVKIIEIAFAKADKSGDGVLTVQDLKGVFNARKHPKYQNGAWTEKQVFEDFLRSFDSPTNADNKVTKEEFINYYAGVSNSIDNDAYFDLMMRNAWKI